MDGFKVLIQEEKTIEPMLERIRQGNNQESDIALIIASVISQCKIIQFTSRICRH